MLHVKPCVFSSWFYTYVLTTLEPRVWSLKPRVWLDSVRDLTNVKVRVRVHLMEVRSQ